MTITVRQPADDLEARLLIGSLLPLIDTPGNRRLHSPESLELTFGSGQRSAERTWVAQDAGHPVGLVAARQWPGWSLVDVFAIGPGSVSAASVLDALLAAATAWARGRDSATLAFFAGADGLADRRAIDVLQAAARAGLAPARCGSSARARLTYPGWSDSPARSWRSRSITTTSK